MKVGPVKRWAAWIDDSLHLRGEGRLIVCPTSRRLLFHRVKLLHDAFLQFGWKRRIL